jgi:uncharacterized protein (DUF1697 family)
MQRYVALLRGMNLGNRRLPMTRLKALVEELGFDAVQTFIASGNVIFSSKATDSAKLQARIAKHLETSLGYPVDTFVRTTDEIAALGRAKVFAEEGQDGITIHVGFFQQALSPEIARKFSSVGTKEDVIVLKGREYFWLCRVRTPDSKVWTLPETRALRLPTSTMRNISSIRKLIAKHIV